MCFLSALHYRIADNFVALNFRGSPIVIQFVGLIFVVVATPSMLAMQEFRGRLIFIGELFWGLDFNHANHEI